MPTPGTYQFHITVIDGSESATSPDVSVEYIATGPGTPTHYNRDKISNCNYQITFTTANDGGKTVKVELYRSTERTYTADASTFVDAVAIGSNQDGSFTTTKPVCGDTYYYAIRAFDALGNGSGVVSDTRTVTVTTGGGTTTVTTTVGGGGGAIPVGGGAVAGAAAGGATGGTVAGEETAPGAEGQNPPTTPGQVLGEEQANPTGISGFISRHKTLSIILALIILALLYYAYLKRKRAQKISKLPPENPTNPPAAK